MADLPSSPGPHPLVFLIGYRGTGKSTVARLLASRIGWAWTDTDALVEQEAGCSIRQLFQEDGEAGFRRRESRALRDLCRQKDHVVATGGGIILDPANRLLMRSSGFVAWLQADPQVIARRLAQDPTTADRRPHLTVGGLPEIRQLLAQRTPLYLDTAHVAVDTATLTPDQAAATILTLWQACDRDRTGPPAAVPPLPISGPPDPEP